MSLLCRTTAKPKRIHEDVAALQNYMKQRQSSAMFGSPNLPIVNDVDAALASLIANGIVQRDPDGDHCSIVPERYLVALYYSNMAVHHFVIAAFSELGLLNVTHDESSSGDSVFRKEVLRLRDLFKFEFFFSPKDHFRQQFVDEFVFLGAPIEALGKQDGAAAEALLRRQPLLVAFGVLSPFINAYRVVAKCLLDADLDTIDDRNTFIASCQAESRRVGAGYPGFASKALLTNGYLLAENRGLLGDEPSVAEKRQRFVDELDLVSEQLEEIRKMNA
jgi:glycerol-3-phosphate O-acyltransferase